MSENVEHYSPGVVAPAGRYVLVNPDGVVQGAYEVSAFGSVAEILGDIPTTVTVGKPFGMSLHGRRWIADSAEREFVAMQIVYETGTIVHTIEANI